MMYEYTNSNGLCCTRGELSQHSLATWMSAIENTNTNPLIAVSDANRVYQISVCNMNKPRVLMTAEPVDKFDSWW
jgi:hypothetical protein